MSLSSLGNTRLDMNIRGPGGRFKTSGVYPLVLEPRWVGDDERVCSWSIASG